MDFLEQLSPFYATLIFTLFTWFVTALGASVVFLFKSVNKKMMDLLLGFGAGVMIAASFWSLLAPAIELSEELGFSPWLPPAIGFLTGGLFIVIADKVYDRYGFNRNPHLSNSGMKRSLLLVTAVTLHNIPEGMAIGVAFACAALGVEGTSVSSAVILAIGIGLQNFPEGAAVSLPLRREGLSRFKSFFYGQSSGLVEPIAGLLGVLAALTMRSILPFLLAFSAGAMIGVVTGELIPESTSESKNIAIIGVVLGFITMMVLDVALG